MYFRDFKWDQAKEGLEVYGAALGVEVRELCPNPACLFWVQIGVRGDNTLDGDYSTNAWEQFQLATVQKGAGWAASGARIERKQYHGTVLLNIPGDVLRVRERWTPVFEMYALPTGTTAVVKIREVQAGKMLVFGTGPSKVYFYEGPLAGEEDTPSERKGALTAVTDLAAASASDATDVAFLTDKLWVTRASANDVFFVDVDSGTCSINYMPRGEARQPKFLETVGSKVLLLCVNAGLGSARTRCYDLSFDNPKLVWTLDDAVTLTDVSNGKLLLGAGTKLYSSDGGTAAPTLLKTFVANVTALTYNYAGLSNGRAYKNISNVWTYLQKLNGSVGAIRDWYATEENKRALIGTSDGPWDDRLRSELASGLIVTDHTLIVPADLAPATVDGVRSMGRFAAELIPATETQPAEIDERMLIGTEEDGLLFIYRLNDLSEDDGAFLACYDTVQRSQPLYRPIVEAETT